MDMDMKKIFAAAAAAILLLSSCDSWLEEKNYGSFTTEEMMANEENVILLVGQAYADVKWVHDHWGYWGVASLTSDECLCPIRTPGDHWADGNYWRNLNTHNWDPLSTAFRNIWNTTISGAVLCNKLLGTLEDGKANMNEAMYKQYVAELEVLRSYYYYLLFDCFGRVPYIEEFVTKTEPLMEPSKVWSKLVDCLERNAPNMPVVNDANRASNYGRVTQGFAYALLARLYLNAPSFDCTPSNISLTNEFTTAISSETDFYTNAVRCCDAIINAGSYSIEDNFFNNFKIKNEGSKENIFVIVEDGRSSVDVRENGSMMNKLRVNLLTLHYCHQNTYGMIEKPWNGFCARPTFLKRYAASDVRGDPVTVIAELADDDAFAPERDDVGVDRHHVVSGRKSGRGYPLDAVPRCSDVDVVKVFGGSAGVYRFYVLSVIVICYRDLFRSAVDNAVDRLRRHFLGDKLAGFLLAVDKTHLVFQRLNAVVTVNGDLLVALIDRIVVDVNDAVCDLLFDRFFLEFDVLDLDLGVRCYLARLVDR